MTNTDHRGRMAVITGASSGIGEATARPTNGVYAATKFGLGGWSAPCAKRSYPTCASRSSNPARSAPELVDHLTHAETKRGVQQLYETSSLAAEDIAQITAFTLSRPRHVAVNEILVRPAGQT